MSIEKLISAMFTINVQARLWHWMTDKAQHHTTFEQFLTQNETFMDSFVESALGNDFSLDFKVLNVTEGKCESYSIDKSRDAIKKYRMTISEAKKGFEKTDKFGAEELTTILDDIIELCSKTLYLLSLK